MYYDRIQNEYFEWMYEIVCGDRFSDRNSYKKLLKHLHEVEFTYRIRKDGDRAYDGVDLRHRFALFKHDYAHVTDCLDGPCSVLEMLVALAIRCEESIMDDINYGDRTAQWFWKMINNLRLGSMTDDRYDDKYVADVIDIFLRRKYEPDGCGGLFRIKHCDYDLRTVEIWKQAMWYLDTML